MQTRAIWPNLVAVVLAACASRAPVPGGPGRPVALDAPAASSAPPSPDASATAVASAAPVTPSASAPLPPFAPPEFVAPHERTRAAGDGSWHPLPGLAAGPDGSHALLTSMVHPHGIKKHVRVALVAIDLARVDVQLVAGTRDPSAPHVPADRKTGLVPASDWPRLLAVFNGGWLEKHGHYGLAVGSDELLAPREDACTVVLGADSSVRIGPWRDVQEQARAARAWRQAPACLVTHGVLHPDLSRRSAPWGLAADGKADIRRSALGLGPGGRTLYFGFGEWLTPGELAHGLVSAGIEDATELDVNWSYVRFITYALGEGGVPRASGTLVADVKSGRGEYVERPSPRDFFYLATRPAP